MTKKEVRAKRGMHEKERESENTIRKYIAQKFSVKIIMAKQRKKERARKEMNEK